MANKVSEFINKALGKAINVFTPKEHKSVKKVLKKPSSNLKSLNVSGVGLKRVAVGSRGITGLFDRLKSLGSGRKFSDYRTTTLDEDTLKKYKEYMYRIKEGGDKNQVITKPKLRASEYGFSSGYVDSDIPSSFVGASIRGKNVKLSESRDINKGLDTIIQYDLLDVPINTEMEKIDKGDFILEVGIPDKPSEKRVKFKRGKDIIEIIGKYAGAISEDEMFEFIGKFEEYMAGSGLNPDRILRHKEALSSVVRIITEDNPHLYGAGYAWLQTNVELHAAQARRDEKLVNKLIKEFNENPSRLLSPNGIPYSSLDYEGLRADIFVEAIFRMYKREAIARGLTVAQFRRALDDILSAAPYELYEGSQNTRGNITRSRRLKPVNQIFEMAIAQGSGYRDYTHRE